MKRQARTTPSVRACLFSAGAILCWATVAIAFKWGLSETTPAPLLFVGTLTATCALALWLGVSRLWESPQAGKEPLTKRDWGRAALLGLINPFLYYLILFKAYSLLPAQVAQALNVIWPVLLVLLSIPILGQRISRVALTGMLVSMAGAFIIATQGNLAALFSGQIQNPVGVVLAASSSILWALYFLLNSKTPLPPVKGLLLNFLFASLYILLYILVTGWTHLSEKAILCGIYIGLFEMAIPFILWLYALRYARNTAVVSSLIYIFPFLSLILIHFVLGESIYATTPIGLILIVIGVFVSRK